MFAPILSFIVNFVTFLALFLISIGNLASSPFFTTFHLLRVTFSDGQGPQGGALNVPYQSVTFGLWNYCYGSGGSTSACSAPHIEYSLDFLPKLYEVDQMFVPEIVRSFGKATVLFIPAACVAFLALVLSFMALLPRFRKRWIHGIAAFLSLLVTVACVLLMVVVWTVHGARKIQFDLHMVPEVHASLGPATWMSLAIVPLAVLGSLVGAFAVCCPNRFKSTKAVKDLPPDTKEKA
ncbi:hypothetical protein KVV02_000523 [Mortierella alpina]|uniref:Uncharacterized protein n=1 Tax=Mortierella alpina TaxID=64518 RepID=A0A9P8CZV6_MORAP|nr:hypothetical protein KVV02_000523 [Mortierella alpina]